MIVYLIKAGEWETDVDCVCATKEIAERECKRLGKEYNLNDNEIEEYIDCIEMELISE